MANKVRVYGKAQNRTALGIMNAYQVINPQATMADFQKAFPDSLNPDSGVRINFVDMKKIKSSQPENWNGFFSNDDELLRLSDGTEMAVVKMWTKPSFERLVSRAAEYGIEIAEFTEAEKGGKKGGFRLEYINGFVPVAAKKKSILPIVIGGVVVAAAAAFFGLRSCNAEKPEIEQPKIEQSEPEPVAEEIVEAVEEIEKDFNAIQFEAAKAELNDETKNVLDKLADLLNQHQELKVTIIGHTSADGTEAANQKLSEERAAAAADYLFSKGIAGARIKTVGKGSSEPIDANNPEANRRTEFVVE